VLAGALAQRLCVLESGKQSAKDPTQTLLVQSDGMGVPASRPPRLQAVG
jgi:hypothetical protein